eukprot:scaffold20737_cov52-Attheya_sp.AAC.2
MPHHGVHEKEVQDNGRQTQGGDCIKTQTMIGRFDIDVPSVRVMSAFLSKSTKIRAVMPQPPTRFVPVAPVFPMFPWKTLNKPPIPATHLNVPPNI